MVKARVTRSGVDVVYPTMMESINNPGKVVLFTQQQAGVVLSGSDKLQPIGYYSDDWVSCMNVDTWRPFNGSIVIES